MKSSASGRFVGGPDLRQNLSRVHQGRLSLSSIGTLSHDGTFVRFLMLETFSQALRVFSASCEKGNSKMISYGASEKTEE